jgi:hypothetical protein
MQALLKAKIPSTKELMAALGGAAAATPGVPLSGTPARPAASLNNSMPPPPVPPHAQSQAPLPHAHAAAPPSGPAGWAPNPHYRDAHPASNTTSRYSRHAPSSVSPPTGPGYHPYPPPSRGMCSFS